MSRLPPLFKRGEFADPRSRLLAPRGTAVQNTGRPRGLVMSNTMNALPRRRFSVPRKVLPYLLSLPALLVCIGIFIPFVTAVIYSLQRYRLSQPWARKWARSAMVASSDSPLR